MPELDPESDHPPRVGPADKSSSQHPEPEQHDDGETIMQHLGLHEPREVHAQKAHRHRTGPVEHERLIRLDDVLRPMEEHDAHEALQGNLVPARIEPLGKAHRTSADRTKTVKTDRMSHAGTGVGEMRLPMC